MGRTSTCGPSRSRSFDIWRNTPDGWCLRNTSTCAQFYGGVTSSDSNAVMWQWSGGGGTFNGFGDFDQIDANRTPAPNRTPA